jgi:predicted O-methyltransferase YrrM
MTDKSKLMSILHEMPKMHFWNGDWQHGGLSSQLLEELYNLAFSSGNNPPQCILETGAGLSTLVFLAGNPGKLITIAPDNDLMLRIKEQAHRFNLDESNHDVHIRYSEDALPMLSVSDEQYLDLALIDGGHGYPTVFVDFCYINKILKKNGLLALDDIQLHAVRELYKLLKYQPDYVLYRDLGKMAVFKKITDIRLFPDFGGQPYLAEKPDTPYSFRSFIKRYLFLRKRI